MKELTLKQNLDFCSKWNENDSPYPDNQTIQGLFELQVSKTPHNIATIFDDTALTYRQLNIKVNQLANYLRKEFQIKQNDLIALFLDKSENMLVSILAVLKSGGAYVPIDPAYPDDRVSYLIEDIEPKLLIAHNAYKHRIEKTIEPKLNIRCLKVKYFHEIASKALLEKCSQLNPKIVNTSRDLAYVLYTSGTTGHPKGSMNEHTAFVNRSWFFIQNYNLGIEDVFLQKTPYVFDVSAWEFFIPLFCGAKVVIPSLNSNQDISALYDYIEKYKVTRLHFTPSLLQALLDGLSHIDKNLTSVSDIYVSGEAFPCGMVKSVKAKIPQASIHNIYGPSEGAITHYDNITPKKTTIIPIGKPIPNAKAYVLDENLLPLPPGEQGELYLGGVGLAREYCKLPELTKKKFIKNPFQTADELLENKNSRIYKTGDLARWLADGNLEYLGRNDFQVKINGHRIELLEIEMAINTYPGIKQSIVLANEREGGPNNTVEKYLIGYYCASKKIDEEKLWMHLNKKLPGIMIPSIIKQLDKFPLTINGKVDRHKLSSLEPARKDYDAPLTNLQFRIVEIWSVILGLGKNCIGINDTFLRLGGNSILAFRLVIQMKLMLNLTIKVSDIFKHDTVAKLSDHLQKEHPQKNIMQKANVVDRNKEEIPASFLQEQLWVANKIQNKPALYNIVTWVEMHGDLDIPAFKRGLYYLVNRHENLRTVINDQDGRLYQSMELTGDTVNLVINLSQGMHYEDLNRLKEKTIQSCLSINFDLGTGPLYQFDLLSDEDNSHFFIFTVHHIISDGWSLEIFYKELGELYASFINHQDAKLENIQWQYADFALMQRKLFDKKQMENQLDFWKIKLDTVPDKTGLPIDKPRSADRNYESGHVSISINNNLKARLDLVCRKHNVTLYMLLMTIYMVLLKRYSQQTRIIVGAPVANRTEKELENIFGFFITMLPIDIQYDRGIKFNDLLGKVKQALLDAFENKDVSFDRIVDILNIKRDLSRNPIFQSVFVMHNAKKMSLSLQNINCSEIHIESKLIKFDFLLSAFERNDTVDLDFEYAKDLFFHDTVERFANNFFHLLSHITDNSEEEIEQLTFISKNEKNLLLEWSAEDQLKNYNIQRGIHHIFEEQVELSDDKVALYFKEQTISFRELNASANQLARLLIEKEINSGDFVCVYMDKSISYSIVLLALIKLGAIYLPIHKSYKQKQIKAILQQTQCKLVISDHLSASFHKINIQRLIVSDIFNELDNYSGVNLASNIENSLKNELYVLFTSGSTGVPKGVQGSHSGILNRFYWMWKQYPYSERETACFFTPINTIDVFFELFGPLLKGYPVVIVSADEILNPDQLIDILSKHKVTRIDFIPSYLKMLLDEYPNISDCLPLLKHWGVNGEPLPNTLIKQFNDQLPHAKLVSRYGSTEATSVFFQEYSSGQLVNAGVSSNAILHILDENKQAVPIGVQGEIYVSGPVVTKGYLGQPILTKERLVKLPNDDRIFFKTGDLGKFKSDGNIEFMGRQDFQVKLHGFNVDLPYIEECIRKQRYIKNVVLLPYKDKYQVTQLSAYVTLTHFIEKLPLKLRDTLKSELPDYMIPMVVYVLDTFPLTSNGKIDRKKLPLTSSKNQQSNDMLHVSKHTNAEKKVLKLWKEMFHIEEIDISSNFFELGGNSLLAIRMLTRIRREFSIDMMPKDIFINPTVAGIAGSISNLVKNSFEEELV